MRDPLLPDDELEDLSSSVKEVSMARAAGIGTVVELTPLGLGRDPAGLREISRRTGVHVVMATGLHHEGHYATESWAREADEGELAELFVRDLTVAAAPDAGDAPLKPVDGVRAGMIKIGCGYWRISKFERRNLLAAASAHRKTGAPITCHLELGSAGHEVLDLLAAAGVSPSHVVLAHVDRNPDPDLHVALAERGAYLSYDGCGRVKHWPDSMLIDCLLAAVDGGAGDRIVLGADIARASRFRANGGLPGITYLPERFLPRLIERGGEQLAHQIMVANPAHLLSFVNAS